MRILLIAFLFAHVCFAGLLLQPPHPPSSTACNYNASGNLVMEFDAGNTAQFNSGSITDGTAVSSWADTIGTFTAVETDGSLKPIWKANQINGRGIVRFNASTLGINTSAGGTVLINSAAATTIVMIFKNSSASPLHQYFFLLKPSTGNPPGFALDTSSGNKIWFEGDGGSDWVPGQWSTAVDTTTYHIHAFQYNGSGKTTLANFSYALDKASLTTASSLSSTGNGAGSFIGSPDGISEPTFMLNMDLALILKYNAALDTTAMTSLYNCINSNLGL